MKVLRCIIYIWIALMIPGLAFGQGSIKGTILNASTNQPVARASIQIQGTKLGSTSDDDGFFDLGEVVPGDYTLIVSHLSYQRNIQHVTVINGALHTDILLSPGIYDFNPVIISATLTRRRQEDIPSRLERIDQSQIRDISYATTDDLLRPVSNVYVNRSWGIFSKNSSVTMRGLNSSSRTLILLNGIPLNKTAGGSVNWHIVQPDVIDNIEVYKGPNSALYGNNAMGGVISIRTKKPEKPIQGTVKAMISSYQTYGGMLDLGGRYRIRDKKSLYWNINLFGRQGDGYILEPEDSRNEFDTEAYLKEINSHAMLGYQFNKNHTLELQHFFSNAKHGNGTQVYEEDGGFDQYITNIIQASYMGIAGRYHINANIFFHKEDYQQQSESMSQSNKYKLSELSSDKHDYGTTVNISRDIFKTQTLTFGIESKQGDVNSSTVYHTSTDRIDYTGKLSTYALFVQDELRFSKGKGNLIAGFRYDHDRFFDGSISIIDPTSNTGFIQSQETEYQDDNWNNLSPKLALKYQVIKSTSLYGSIGTGFMPPKLDDMCMSGKIRKGFKVANPGLTPERLVNYEMGSTVNLIEKIKIEPSLYLSMGNDFQYLIGTGDSIDTGGDDFKPVFQRRNVSKVRIAGAEITFTYSILPSLVYRANYAYNHSTITAYDADPESNKDLTGKFLNEVPMHQFFTSITFQHKWVNTSISYQYIGEQWFDDENTLLLEPYSLVDLKLYRTFWRKLKLTLIVQNLFDEVYIDRKGLLSPGRFITGEVSFIF